MAASLAELPNELLKEIIGHCSGENTRNTRNTLANVRLTSSRLESVATDALFKHLYLGASINEGRRVRKIMASEKLKSCIRSLTFNSQYRDPGCESHQHGFERLSGVVKDSLWDCCRAELLSGVEIQLERSPELRLDARVTGVFNDYSYQAVRKLLQTLNTRPPTTSFIRSLKIKNLQCYIDQSLMTQPEFSILLSRLHTLKLSFASILILGLFNDDNVAEAVYFYKSLCSIWLTPVSQGLTTLSLDAGDYWGYNPKIDFSRTHFPKLKTLALGHYLWSHDWQLQWLLSHGGTLEHLYMEMSPLLVQYRSSHELDNEGYPLALEEVYTVWSRSATRNYTRRWSYYLTEIAGGLHHLQTFKMSDVDGKMASEGYENFESMIHMTRYIDHGVHGYRFNPPTNVLHDALGEGDWVRLGEEDANALKALEEVIDKRKKQGCARIPCA